MKSIFFLCLAGACAVAPPRIELNLGDVTAAYAAGGLKVQHRPNNINSAAGNYTKTEHHGGTDLTNFVADADKNGQLGERPAESGGTNPVKVHVIQLDEPIWREHHDGATQPAQAKHEDDAFYPSNPNGQKVKSRQDFTIRCAVCENNCGTYHEDVCKLPMAKAYDHYETEVPVNKTLWRVDYQSASDLNQANPGSSTTEESQKTSIDWQKRATYLIKYDAQDATGNRAEQVVVAVIVDDLVPPTISSCLSTAEAQIEAGKGWKLCDDSTALDNVDHDVSARIRVSVQKCADDTITGDCNSWVDTKWTTDCKAGQVLPDASHASDAFKAHGCKQSHGTFNAIEQQYLDALPGLTAASGDNYHTDGFYLSHGVAGRGDPRAREPLSDRKPGLYKVIYWASDMAGIYGSGYADNE